MPPRAAGIELDVDGRAWRVHGVLDALRPQGLVHWRYARRQAADLIGGWLAHLLLCADAPPGVALATTGVARDGCWRLRPCGEPREALRTLLRLYARGLREPLPFFPKTSLAYVETGGPSGVLAAERVFRPAPESPTGRYAESNDAGVRLALRGRPDPFEPGATTEFVQCAEAVFGPLMNCLVDDAANDAEPAV
jgi:exodeoxyribonuclease V gamma subunit